jgi:hypothetical protein
MFAGHFVHHFAPSFDRLTAMTPRCTARPSFVIRFFVFLFLACIGGSAAATANASTAPSVSIGPGPQFAVSDFDGDLHPDMASIEAGPNVPGRTDYWIQLRLSASGEQFIRVAGPAGGLQIEARDVNGDNAVDLVVATAWFRQPVAIFLNDGHGGFSRVEPTAFPGAFTESRTNWFSTAQLAVDALGVPPQPDFGICGDRRTPTRLRCAENSVAGLHAGFLSDPFLISHAGRAPPSELPQL